MELVLSHYLPFQCTFQWSRLLGVWLRVILLALMLPMSILGFIGDQQYLAGIKQSNIENFKIAKDIFPFDKDFLTGEVNFYIKFGIVNTASYEAFKEATFYDPYAANLLGVQMQQAFLLEDNDNAVALFYKLREMFPKLPIVQELIKRGAR